MKIRTDYGTKKIKPQKTFYFKEVRFAICEVPSKFNGNTTPTTLRKLVHFNSGKLIPVTFLSEKTALKCVETAEKTLNRIFNKVGSEYFYNEINKQIKLN